MRLYVVWEEDRGAGETILDVFTDVEEAKKLCGESAHYSMQEVDFYLDVNVIDPCV